MLIWPSYEWPCVHAQVGSVWVVNAYDVVCMHMMLIIVVRPDVYALLRVHLIG